MPANRSRTLEWRRCLRQVQDRNGALEIAVANPADQSGNAHQLVWRVRLLGLTEAEILVEQPSALGQLITIQPGIELTAMFSIGQNRWMFTTRNLGSIGLPAPGRPSDRHQKSIPALRLAVPEHIQRCQRRHYQRVDTAAINLPQVEIWPLLDPKSVLVAERAYEIEYEADLQASSKSGTSGPRSWFDHESVMPEVGPKFTATLLNLGGGGVGLRVEPDDAQLLARHKLFWLRFSLPPALKTPICATGKLVHTHMESSHDTYAGLAFDFSFNPVHQRFVVDQICRYIAFQQEAQQRQDAAGRRRTA